jgi:hypothetical protein
MMRSLIVFLALARVQGFSSLPDDTAGARGIKRNRKTPLKDTLVAKFICKITKNRFDFCEKEPGMVDFGAGWCSSLTELVDLSGTGPEPKFWCFEYKKGGADKCEDAFVHYDIYTNKRNAHVYQACVERDGACQTEDLNPDFDFAIASVCSEACLTDSKDKGGCVDSVPFCCDIGGSQCLPCTEVLTPARLQGALIDDHFDVTP